VVIVILLAGTVAGVRAARSPGGGTDDPAGADSSPPSPGARPRPTGVSSSPSPDPRS
jgi:hypothetical protein